MTQGAPAMQAWVSASPGVGNLKVAPMAPPVASAREALVRVECAALNFSDLLMIDDSYQIRPPRPFIPGQEIAGTVVASGSESGLIPGERIASKVLWGGFAEYAVVRGDMAIRIPQAMPSDVAAALPIVYTTAAVALTEIAPIKRGDIVLVLAAGGGVGLAAVEIARHAGARVIAGAGGEEKLRLARDHGAHDAIDYRDAGWSDAVKTLTGDHGADIIVDPVGGAATLEALRVLAWGGRLLIVGFSSGEIAKIPANRLLIKRAAAFGIYWSHDRDAAMLARISATLVRHAAEGVIRPHIGAVYPFEDLPKALAELAQRRIVGKAIIRLTDQDRSR